MHLFGRNRDHDYYFGLLSEEEQDAQSAAEGGTGAQRSKRAGATTVCVSRFSFLQDRDVGVFPESEEVLVFLSPAIKA